MSLTLNTRVFNHIKNGLYNLSTVLFGQPKTTLQLSSFAFRKGGRVTGGLSASKETDVTVGTDTERRTDTVAVQVIGHSATDVATIRQLMGDLNALVQSADFPAYMAGRIEF